MATSLTGLSRRNFTLGVIAGAFINVGMAFLDPLIVLPLFITKLGGSVALVGLMSALHGVGWFLPQIFATRLAETRDRLMPLYRIISVVRSITLAGAVLSVFVLPASGGVLAFSIFAILFFLTQTMGGLAAIPFLEVVGQTIPVTLRGRFFGLRRFLGGILGVFTGLVVGLVLDERTERFLMSGPVFDVFEAMAGKLGILGHAFPINFAILFLFGWIWISLGMFSFSLARENPTPRTKEAGGIFRHLRSGWQLMAKDPNYRRFYLVRICWQFTAMAFPFYATYAFSQLGFSASTMGFFLSTYIAAGVLSNYFWGKLLDKSGNKIVLFLTAILSALPPMILLVIDRGAGQGFAATGSMLALAMVAATFLINGAIRSGRIISDITYLLEFAPADKRPLYVGFMNSFTFPFMLSPLLGGILLQFLGVQVLFSISLVFAALNIFLTLGLREPRTLLPN